jgi:Helix-turn-helix domain
VGHHRNTPLTLERRRKLIEHRRARPIAHVAAEIGISRATASKWINRYRDFGDFGLLDRSSVPLRRPTATSGVIRGTPHLRTRAGGHTHRSSDRDAPAGAARTEPLALHRPDRGAEPGTQRIIAERPGPMIHIDVKKVLQGASTTS